MTSILINMFRKPLHGGIGLLMGMFSPSLSGQELLMDAWFWPDYKLPRNAVNQVGPRTEVPSTPYATIDQETEPLLFKGHAPTHRVRNSIPSTELPAQAFSVELWLEDHVNQPIGSLIAAKGLYKGEAPAWVLGYYNREVYFNLRTDPADGAGITSNPQQVPLKNWRGYKRYFAHLVATYTGDSVCVYINGEPKAAYAQQGYVAFPEHAELEIAGYLENEPYMEMGNHVLNVRLWDGAINSSQVQERFQALQAQVDEGILFPDFFHFTAGPYLHKVTQTSVELTWETSEFSSAQISYGTSLPLARRVEVLEVATLHKFTLNDLDPESTYYYEITALPATPESAQTSKIYSGILTFSTAVQDSSAFSFVAFGDTEARPHINHRMSQLIWEERPNFVINLGDLTDGGREPHKFEWNYEYFLGMTPLNSRIPVFPVPGNGEGDLYWYSQYHNLRPYYSFRYGNAEFFMLNSNEKEQLEPGGEQYLWLEEQLKNSTATWKFAAHHHPVYTSDENDYGNTWEGSPSDLGDLQVRELVQLYERYGVDLVFYGHLHTYERSWPLMEGRVEPNGGVVYLVAGGAGGNLEDFAPTHSWFSTKLYRGHHYCRLDIHGEKLYFKMYDLKGALKDYMELEK